jgi:hypothetical protein
LKIPKSSDVKGRKLQYVVIGDEAFSLRKDFLKPYNVKQLRRERKIFNYRLSRARRLIENVFGILVARFGTFKTYINIQLDNIKDVIIASCALHNFLRRTSPDMYTPSECFHAEYLQNGTVKAGLRNNPLCSNVFVSPTCSVQPHFAATCLYLQHVVCSLTLQQSVCISKMQCVASLCNKVSVSPTCSV